LYFSLLLFCHHPHHHLLHRHLTKVWRSREHTSLNCPVQFQPPDRYRRLVVAGSLGGTTEGTKTSWHPLRSSGISPVHSCVSHSHVSRSKA
jgi:hypothetical protein